MGLVHNVKLLPQSGMEVNSSWALVQNTDNRRYVVRIDAASRIITNMYSINTGLCKLGSTLLGTELLSGSCRVITHACAL